MITFFKVLKLKTDANTNIFYSNLALLKLKKEFVFYLVISKFTLTFIPLINHKNLKDMSITITFNELRKIKDMLPSGSMHRIAEELGINEETVRNYFGGDHYDEGNAAGLHIEQGPDGGIVRLDDTTILEKAKEIIGE